MTDTTSPTSHVVLVGMPGAGKSTAAASLAGALGMTVADVDDEIERRTGVAIPSLIRDHGEEEFRERESEALASLLGGRPAILSGGGGIVTHAPSRDVLRRPGTVVVWLTARLDTLRERIAADEARGARERPLLKDPDALARLQRQRRPLYWDASDLVVSTDGRSGPEVAGEILARLGAARLAPATLPVPVAAPGPDGIRTVRVAVPGRHYDVRIGTGVLAEVGEVVAATGARKAAIVTHRHLAERFGRVRETVGAAGVEVLELYMGEGETAKSLGTVGEMLEAMAEAELHRHDVVVGVGGGVVTDTAGFAAATYMRGVRWVSCPTSILGAVDASVGGKTGVNLAAGKNLAGAFWQPESVLVDTATFTSLPPREVRSGLAEVVKHGFIDDPAVLETVEQWGRVTDASNILATLVATPGALDEVVARSIAVKARIVAADEREGGLRALLNYGHTFGHALETACGYDLTHGEAISIGMVFAAELARATGRLDAAAVERHRSVLEALGLPVGTAGESVEAAVPLMRRDKKAAEGLRFVLLDAIGSAGIVEDVPDTMVRSALAAVTSP